jgi:hypothetical protein
MGDDDFAYELVALVDAGVKLIAEVVLAMFLRPLGVNIFLRAFVRLPGNRHGAFLDGLSFLALLRWTGACTREASMIWPQRAR